jgi:ferric-dicitrate binding protein FerR (iron transport regulator)
MTEEAIKRLLEKFLVEELSGEEFRQLWASLQQPENKELWMGLTGEVWNNTAFHGLSDERSRKEALDRIMATGVTPEIQKDRPPIRLFANYNRGWWAVAAILLVLLGGAYFFFQNAASRQSGLTREQRIKNDVAPGKNAAVLTLAGGQQIVLDSTANGTIGRQGASDIVNRNGQLAYNTLHEKEVGVMYNTLTTQRGNQYQLVLPDGSKVWLNAASSITYPTVFSDKERKVTIAGEAYFEVTKDAGKPFKVAIASRSTEGPASGEKDHQGAGEKAPEIEVLGTSFNVNAYAEENDIETTLLEGSIRVRTSLLKPGEQAALDRNGMVSISRDADVERIVAWKNNLFIFSKDDIRSIMRQLSRWYKVEVVYQGDLTGRHFSGIISRNNSLSQVLAMLESTEKVKFLVEGSKITVIG